MIILTTNMVQIVLKLTPPIVTHACQACKYFITVRLTERNAFYTIIICNKTLVGYQRVNQVAFYWPMRLPSMNPGMGVWCQFHVSHQMTNKCVVESKSVLCHFQDDWKTYTFLAFTSMINFYSAIQYLQTILSDTDTKD